MLDITLMKISVDPLTEIWKMSLDEEYGAVYSRYCPEHEEEYDGSATERNLTRKDPFRRLGLIFLIGIQSSQTA